MTISHETRSLSHCLEALSQAHKVLLDENRNVVERVNVVWPTLNFLPFIDLPSPWRLEWAALSKRAAHLATAEAPGYTLTSMDEAGDIGSIILCLEWLLRRNPVLPMELQGIAQRS